MATQRAWQVDWAGPHGTAWGTVNATLTTITCAWLGHLVVTRWPTPPAVMVLIAVAITTTGMVMLLLRVALSRHRTNGVTLSYRLACWVGAGSWVAVMVAEPEWSWRWWLPRAGVLITAAAVAGVLAGLAGDGPDPEPAAPKPEPSDEGQRWRDSQAEQWERRISRVCGISGVHVPAIEQWQRRTADGRPVGYTVEAVLPEGGKSWKQIAEHGDDLAADLDLGPGCKVNVEMGVTRRAALINVTAVDVLGEDYPYPDDYSDLTVLDPVPMVVRDDGTVVGPRLREKCMAVFGETGSGKTNAAHCTAASGVRTVDALLWDIDQTGGGLSLPWNRAYIEGRAQQPAIDWMVTNDRDNGREALWMVRAAKRIIHVRKSAYQDLMRHVNDDKIPVSADLPEVLLRVDEITPITGQPSRFPDTSDGIRDVVFEGRASAVRALLFGLRATNDVLRQDVQSQCHVVAVMRAKDAAEYAWAFGWHSGADPVDAPYPGTGFLSLASGERPVPVKWWRLRPDQIDQIALAVDGRRPQLDEVSRMAANGRNPDGTPMPDLMPGELDCYDTRWERWAVQNAQPLPTRPAPPSPPLVVDATRAEGAASPAEAIAGVHQAVAELRDAVTAAKAARADQVPVDADAWADVLAAWDADPYVRDREPTDPGEPPTHGPALMLDLITDAGQVGVGPKELRAQLAHRGVTISRDTLHEWLRAAIEAGRVARPRQGRYVRQDPT